jgi:hypothetical protein
VHGWVGVPVVISLPRGEMRWKYIIFNNFLQIFTVQGIANIKACKRLWLQYASYNQIIIAKRVCKVLVISDSKVGFVIIITRRHSKKLPSIHFTKFQFMCPYASCMAVAGQSSSYHWGSLVHRNVVEERLLQVPLFLQYIWNLSFVQCPHWQNVEHIVHEFNCTIP